MAFKSGGAKQSIQARTYRLDRLDGLVEVPTVEEQIRESRYDLPDCGEQLSTRHCRANAECTVLSSALLVGRSGFVLLRRHDGVCEAVPLLSKALEGL